MDLLKELRLRRWARENYVSVEERQPKWHPIVLEEMQRKDEEFEAAMSGVPDEFAFAENRERLEWNDIDPRSKVVPLLPMPLRLDPPHLGPTPPHFLSRPDVETVADDADWGFYLG